MWKKDFVVACSGGIAAAALVGGLVYRYTTRKVIVQMKSLVTGATSHRRYTPKPSLLGAPQGAITVTPSQYPVVHREPDSFEVMHGTVIDDPYTYLEDPDGDQTQKFVEAQNKLTYQVLDQCPDRQRFRTLLEQLYDYEKFGVPFKKGERYYYYHNSGLQAQSVLYTQANIKETGKVLIDPNTLSSDGTVALMSTSFSQDGELMAFAISEGGSDWRTVKVMKIDPSTGETTQLKDELKHVKFSSFAWTHDNKGFFYNRYEAAATENGSGDTTAAPHGRETSRLSYQQLCYHRMGTSQSEDVTILQPDHSDWMMGAEITHDGRFMLISVSAGCEPVNRLWFLDLNDIPKHSQDDSFDFSEYEFKKGSKPLPLVKLVDNFEAQFEYIGSSTTEDGRTLWTLQTNLNAPRYRIVRCDPFELSKPPEEWEDVIPQHPKDLLEWVSLLKGGVLAVCYLSDVKNQLQLRDFTTGKLIKELEMPGIGSIGGFSGSRKSTEFFFSFTSFTEPGAQFRCDVSEPDATKPELIHRTKTKFNPDVFETKQVFMASKDATKIPMFIVHKKGLKLDGTAPTLLYGYGGFNISLTPSFSVARLTWMLAFNGILAVANIRGGGEFGREWRDAGSLGNKQNCFDDFQACAEFLHSYKYTSPTRTVIQGGSNGGLLVAACANQRPDLFAVVLGQVGVYDKLRFHRYTIGHAWQTDYGDVDIEEHFNWLLPISPLHNVAIPEGGTKQYPAIMLTSGDHDDRVVPLHTLKLIATLQHVLAGSADSVQRNPLLARIEVKTGHGAGKPTKKILDETSDMFSFAAGVMSAPWALHDGDLKK